MPRIGHPPAMRMRTRDRSVTPISQQHNLVGGYMRRLAPQSLIDSQGGDSLRSNEKTQHFSNPHQNPGDQMIEADDSISDGVGDIKIGKSEIHPRERVVHSFSGTQIQPTAILSKADRSQPNIPKPRGASRVRHTSKT